VKCPISRSLNLRIDSQLGSRSDDFVCEVASPSVWQDVWDEKSPKNCAPQNLFFQSNMVEKYGIIWQKVGENFHLKGNFGRVIAVNKSGHLLCGWAKLENCNIEN
jgi:hypothetical protein